MRFFKHLAHYRSLFNTELIPISLENQLLRQRDAIQHYHEMSIFDQFKYYRQYLDILTW
jgi:hypothetical protein